VSESEYPLLETMGYYQRFSQKLWLAGGNKNWELADFYVHELHEVTEELIEAGVIHDGQNLSQLAEAIFEESLDKVDSAIDSQNQVLFRKSYEMFISSCNSCHSTTGHSFIRITVPNDSSIFNQKFSLY
jgi:hypothetical protein